MALIDKWLNNLKQIGIDKKSGKCPYCGSETDYTFVGDIGKVGYAVIWCPECKKAYHISRVKIETGYPLNKPIPTELIY